MDIENKNLMQDVGFRSSSKEAKAGTMLAWILRN
jgi:hypothetical protein